MSSDDVVAAGATGSEVSSLVAEGDGQWTGPSFEVVALDAIDVAVPEICGSVCEAAGREVAGAEVKTPDVAAPDVFGSGVLGFLPKKLRKFSRRLVLF
jgi:hypothetical protein